MCSSTFSGRFCTTSVRQTFWSLNRDVDERNAGKGDPPGKSQLQRDIQKEKDLDRTLKNPPPLPDWLSEHDRKASRVDVDVRPSCGYPLQLLTITCSPSMRTRPSTPRCYHYTSTRIIPLSVRILISAKACQSGSAGWIRVGESRWV